MNRDQAEALARFLHLCRPEWDAPGILHALGAARNSDPLNAGLAAIRWTANPELRTPGGMGKPGEHWTERVIAGAPRPPRPTEACRTCGRSMHAADVVCGEPTLRPTPKPTDVTTPVAHLRALRDETAGELCHHGVKASNCLAHTRETEPETDQPKES